MHGDAEGPRVMVGVSKKGGEDLHPGRSGFSVSILLCSFHTSLAVNGIFPKFCSGICVPLQMDLEEPQERMVGKEESDTERQELPALRKEKDQSLETVPATRTHRSGVPGIGGDSCEQLS